MSNNPTGNSQSHTLEAGASEGQTGGGTAASPAEGAAAASAPEETKADAGTTPPFSGTQKVASKSDSESEDKPDLPPAPRGSLIGMRIISVETEPSSSPPAPPEEAGGADDADAGGDRAALTPGESPVVEVGEPTAAPEQAASGKTPSQIPPAPGTQGAPDPGWTPPPADAVIEDYEDRLSTQDIEELLEGGAQGDEAAAPPPPPARPASVSHDSLPPPKNVSSEPEVSVAETAAVSDAESDIVQLDGDDLAEAPPTGPPPPKGAPPPAPLTLSGADGPGANAPPPPPKVEKSKNIRAPAPEPIGAKKRVRPWWEEVFDDDFLRSIKVPPADLIRKESAFIEERLGLAEGALILDLACGDGRHAVQLTQRGYQVVGYDLSLAMLARAADEAEAANQRINFLQGDMREMAFDSMFDGVYCWGTSFGFFDEEKNMSVLERVYKALRPGGVFLLDVYNRDYIACRQPSMVWFEGEGCICMDEMLVDFITSRLKVKRTVMLEDGRTREIDYSIRLYGLHELGKMLHKIGFKVLEVSGQLATPGVFFGAESPRSIVVAEKAESQ